MANNSEEDETSIGALLSIKQRDWLADGAPNPDSAAHRSLRQRIRKRVRRSFADYSLLGELPESDLDKMFQDPAVEEYEGLIDALAFIYRGARDGLRVSGHASFEPILKQAIRRVEYDPDSPAPYWFAVEVLFEHDRIIVNKPEFADVDLEEVGKKIDEGDTGDLSRADYAAWARYYRMKQDFDFQYPARMSEMPGTEITSEQSEKEEDS